MEDAHAAILDLQPLEGDKELKPAASDVRISFFGVYDGHGGDKVALYTGEHLHEIVAKQDSFKSKDFEQALKDGFLAIDRAILSGMTALLEAESTAGRIKLTNAQTLNTRRKSRAAQLRWASSRTTRSLWYDWRRGEQLTQKLTSAGQRRRLEICFGNQRARKTFVVRPQAAE